MPEFYEFFAGGGMVRAGLGPSWRCLFANDIDETKAAAYKDNWGDDELVVDDVRTIKTTRLKKHADLAWASFPCQDLSLAGDYAGLSGARSSTFWPFWRIVQTLAQEERAPRLVVIENVPGTLTSNGGRDFAAIGAALVKEGYSFGAVIVDAKYFVPQSRPRMFIVGVAQDLTIPADVTTSIPIDPWHTATLIRAHDRLTAAARDKWVWWRLPLPRKRPHRLSDVLEQNPSGVEWHTPEETAYLLSLMDEVNAQKVKKAKRMGIPTVGTIYRRTRPDGNGKRRQRAEVRFDDVAGCLRTPGGGSSRQTILIVHGETIRSRLLSPREAARLMGLPESYKLSLRYNDAYRVAGDGVVVPVVRHLAAHIFEPLLAVNEIFMTLAERVG